ncbi:unnamed protein product [Caenorhabditis bovis]|uniref:Galectin n=1 Tax=Caenorhabditis bovis TaxID=2654633 RepID=A0A8S1ELP1_9PELO|nr:unnamed protein product [Caenorhabditis bovis]
MPFHRDIDNGLTTGSSIEILAKVYQDQKNPTIALKSLNNDGALVITIVMVPTPKIRIECVLSGKSSTPIEKAAIRVGYQSDFKLTIVTLQYAFRIDLNGEHFADFVHRIHPSQIRKISIEGPMICQEVVINPAKNLPSYEQATSPPTNLMANVKLEEEKREAPSPDDDDPLPPPPPPPGPSFNFTGGLQGFSNHPVPLPGLIGNETNASQQNPVGRLDGPAPPAPPAQFSPYSPAGAQYVPTPTKDSVPCQQGVTVPVARPVVQPTVPVGQQPGYRPYANQQAPPTGAQYPPQTPGLPYTVTFPPSTPVGNPTTMMVNPYAPPPPPPPPPTVGVAPLVQYPVYQIGAGCYPMVYYEVDYCYPHHHRHHHHHHHH